MRSSTGTEGRHGYADALAGLWYGLSQTLGHLDRLAVEPDEETAERLPPLQYALHVAGERVAGMRPPTGSEEAHAELESALAQARDATAEMAEALESAGLGAARLLVYEWRGALFRVRYARQRLLEPPAAAPARPRAAAPSRRSGVVLPLAGALALGIGTFVGQWTLAVAAVLVVAAGLAFRRA